MGGFSMVEELSPGPATRSPMQCRQRVQAWLGAPPATEIIMRFRTAFPLLASVLGALAAGVTTVQAEAASPQVIPTVSLPHRMTGIRAAVAGRPGLYIFDTGVGITIVTPDTAAEAGCHPWGQVTGFRAIGERLDTPRCDDLHLTVGGHDFVAPIAGIADLQREAPPDMPRLAGTIGLDLFAGRVITIRPKAHEIVVETAQSAERRERGATEVPIRLVRDVEGVALTVDGAVPTPSGTAWMELDDGNTGPIMIGQHVAAPLKLDPSRRAGQAADFSLAGGIPVRGPASVGNLIMDGDIGESVLNRWDITFDLAKDRAWFRPAATTP